jgi:hypothetical protein
MLLEIHDQRFMTEFYRDHCHRAVHGKSNQDAIARKHIEVSWLPEYGEQIEVCVCEGLGNALIELGWSHKGAWVIYFHTIDGHLSRCDLTALSTSLRRFLLKHGVIDASGALVQKGVA